MCGDTNNKDKILLENHSVMRSKERVVPNSKSRQSTQTGMEANLTEPEEEAATQRRKTWGGVTQS